MVTDYKLTYLSKILSKIDKKGFETYVITRIWNKLDNLDVKIICQQYVKRDNGYALLDLYFPQINFGVEVNESYHNKPVQATEDEIRKRDVETAVGVEMMVVDCSKSIDEVHQQIDNIVATINNRIASSPNFKPWQGNLTPVDYKNKGVLKVEDDIILSNTDEICQIFGLKEAPKRGFLRKGGVEISNGYLVWWPNAKHPIWINEMSDNGNTIVEYNNDPNKRTAHVNDISENKQDELRITFYRKRDNFGQNYYRFVGVYKIDVEASKKDNMCIWRRISTECIL